MIMRIAILSLLVSSVWGCAVSVHDDALLRDALQQREAAYTKLANAMTSYCAKKHPSLEARKACMVDKRLELMHIRQLNEETASRFSDASIRLPRLLGTEEGGRFPPVRCERAGGRTTCQRLSRAFAEGPGN
jgi:hypothetical protein